MNDHSIKNTCGFEDRALMTAGIPLTSLLVTLLFFHDQIAQNHWTAMIPCLLIAVVHTTVFWFSLRWVYGFIRYRYPTAQEVGKRLMWLALAFVVIFFVIDNGLDALFGALMHMDVNTNEPDPVMEFIASLILSALVVTLYEAISFYTQLQRAVAEKAQLERQNVESQLEGLRNQVNPHFLFNSLNTLIYLIPEDSLKAVSFVQKLSKVYRYVLESRESKLIPLAEELEFLNAYVYLLKERFGDNLRVNMLQCPDPCSIAIVPLSLQMLFENAIKHNVISTEKPLTIEVFLEDRRLGVRNNLQLKNQVMDSTGVGLQNIIDRYRMMTDEKVEVVATEQSFTVSLPVIELSGIAPKPSPVAAPV